MELRSFEKQDAVMLSKELYQNLTVEQIEDMICKWSTKQYEGKYFEMFAIVVDGVVVGRVSLYECREKTIHIGPEIFCKFRKKGYAKEAMNMACDIAKERGCHLISQQIRLDNVASIALHNSLGFQMVGTPFANPKGNKVCIYEKSLD